MGRGGHGEEPPSRRGAKEVAVGAGYGSCGGLRVRGTVGRGSGRGEEGEGTLGLFERNQLRPAVERGPLKLLDVAPSLDRDWDLALASNVGVDSEVTEQDERRDEHVDLLGLHSPEESKGRSRGIYDLEGLDLDVGGLWIDAPTEEQQRELSTSQAAGSLGDDDTGHREGGEKVVGND